MEVWGGRCALSGASGGSGGPSLVLTRWDCAKPASVGNLVLMSRTCAEEHDGKGKAAREEVPRPLRRAVEETLERAANERRAWAA